MKKTKVCLCALAAVASVGVISAVALNNSSMNDGMAEHQKYTITLNVANKISGTEKSAFTRNSARGTPISFTATNLNNRTDDWFAQLASGTTSHLENSTLIGGIESITIKSQFKGANGGYRIQAGTTSDVSDFSHEHTSSGTEGSIVSNTFTFSGNANYFKISNLSSNCGTYISELSITFSCIAADATRDTKEKASGDLLYGSYINSGSIFDEDGYSNDMRCSDVKDTNSGYSVKFHGDADKKGWPVAQIELPNEIDLRGYGLTLDVKFVNAHNWFAFTALDSNGDYIIRQQYGGIGIDTEKDLGNYVSATIPQASINDSTKLEPGRTIDDLAHVKYLVFTFNFENAPSTETAHEVTIDNIKYTRGFKYEPPAEGKTYNYVDLGEQLPLTTPAFPAFDIKFDNPTVHQEVGFTFYQESWGENYFGTYWIDTRIDTGEVYFEGSYKGLKIVPLSDGYYRVYVDLSKLDRTESSKPTNYVQYIFFQAPNTVANRGSGLIDVRPAGRVYAPIETFAKDKEFKSGVGLTVDFPQTFTKNDGVIIADFTFSDEGKAAVIVGNWTVHSKYVSISKTTTGNVDLGINAIKTGDNSVRVTFDLNALRTDADPRAELGDISLFYIRDVESWTTGNGTVSVYHKL